MGKIVVSENTSVDGVVQDPTGEEGFHRGGWFAQVTENDREEWAKAALAEATNNSLERIPDALPPMSFG